MISEEQLKRKIEQQKEQEQAALRQQKREEEWYKRRMEMENTNRKIMEEPMKLQAVKLQKYTVTLFSRDYKDWLRFWNQFTVEVDGSKISEIS